MGDVFVGHCHVVVRLSPPFKHFGKRERKIETETTRCGAARAASPLIELVPLKRHLGSYFRK